MTRDEAIRELKTLRDGFNVLGFCRGQIWYLSDECADAIDMAIKALERDVVECQECARYEKVDDEEYGICMMLHNVYGQNIGVSNDDYCSYGERRSDETD